jgi:hypothetical protein
MHGTMILFNNMILECHTFRQSHIIPFPQRERLYETPFSGGVFIAAMQRG